MIRLYQKDQSVSIMSLVGIFRKVYEPDRSHAVARVREVEVGPVDSANRTPRYVDAVCQERLQQTIRMVAAMAAPALHHRLPWVFLVRAEASFDAFWVGHSSAIHS